MIKTHKVSGVDNTDNDKNVDFFQFSRLLGLETDLTGSRITEV